MIRNNYILKPTADGQWMIELVAGNVKLTLLDGQDRMINTSQMNFRGRDLVELVAAIKECLPAT